MTTLDQAWGPTLKQAGKGTTPVDGQDIRKSFYKMGDGIEGLLRAIKEDSNTKGDKKLAQLVAACDKASTALYRHLEATYKWD